MCGLFGFIGSNPRIDLIKKIALKADERGGHSYGVSLWNEEKELLIIAKGKLEEFDFSKVENQSIILGQSRLSTTGDFGDIASTQPIKIDCLRLLHNGVVRNYKSIMKDNNYEPITQCDSEAIIPLYQNGGMELVQKTLINQPFVIGILSDFKELKLCKHRLPLYVSQRKEGHYFCSKPFEGATEMQDFLTLILRK